MYRTTDLQSILTVLFMSTLTTVWYLNYCIGLYCIVLHCIALHCIALHCIALHCFALYCIVLYCIVLYCIVLYCIVTTLFASTRSDVLGHILPQAGYNWAQSGVVSNRTLRHLPTTRHRGNTLFCRAVTSILSQRLLHKMTNSSAVFIARIQLSRESQYLASILSDTFVKCICRDISRVLGKWSLHSRWNVISTFTELHVHGNERWPMEVTSNTYFRAVYPPWSAWTAEHCCLPVLSPVYPHDSHLVMSAHNPPTPLPRFPSEMLPIFFGPCEYGKGSH